jgi:hypothetical protein
MKFHTALRAGGAALLFAGSITNANACEMWRDEFTKVWRGNCNLTINPKAPQLSMQFMDVVPRPPFPMPDLVIRRFDHFVSNGVVEVHAYVRNEGSQSSFATDVGVTVTTINAADGRIQSFTLPLTPVNALASMTEQPIFMGVIPVDTAAQDVDLLTVGMVDQLTGAQPVRGTVLESNESNNALAHMCRVFGPMPNPIVPGC